MYLVAQATGRSTSRPGLSRLRFLLVAALLGCLAYLAALSLTDVVRPRDPAHRSDSEAPTAMVCVVTLWPVLAAFGTLLPGAALGLPFSPLKALKAVRSTWYRTAFQLLVFPLGLGVAFLAAMLWSYPVFGPELMLTDDVLSWLNHRAPSAQMVIVVSVAMASVALIGVTTVAILCRAFLRETPAT